MTVPAICWTYKRILAVLFNFFTQRQLVLRWAFPVKDHFDPDERFILGEGISHSEMAADVLEYGCPGIIANLHIHNPGSTRNPPNGPAIERYHRTRPNLDTEENRRYARAVFEWLKAQGVPVFGIQLGNELSFAPTEEGPGRVPYLARCVTLTDIMLEEAQRVWPNNTPKLILGGQTGADELRGEETFHHYVARHNLFPNAWMPVHGNGKEIGEVVQQLRWIKAHGYISCVTEDANPGPHSDADARGRAFVAEGARIVTEFGQRDVNFRGNNPSCRWGPNLRRSGAIHNCNGELDRRSWNELTMMCLRFGIQFDVDDDRPMDDDAPPVDPPVDPPMIEQAWDAYCKVRRSHDALLSPLDALPPISRYKHGTPAREFFDTFVDRLRKHYDGRDDG